MKKRSLKRKYEHTLLRRAAQTKENREFLLARLKKEWEAMERDIARDRRNKKLRQVIQETGTTLGFTILGMAAVCGVLFVGAVAPNIFSAFSPLGRRRRYFNKNDFKLRVQYFRRRGYLDVVKHTDGGMGLKLTELGEEQVVKRALGDLRIALQEQWDGVWRVVIFDIPERNKWAREGMRQCLKRMGFYPLQKSTFIFPYSCREEVEFLRRLYDVGHSIRFMETASLSFDEDIKKFFSLR